MVVCVILANTNHLANSLDQRHHVLTNTFALSRGSTSDWCMRECSHLNWASQSHVDQAGVSFLHTQPPPLFSLPFFIFLPLPMLASLSHPPTSMYHLRRIREQSNVLRQIICRIKPNHISADSFHTGWYTWSAGWVLHAVVNGRLSDTFQLPTYIWQRGGSCIEPKLY